MVKREEKYIECDRCQVRIQERDSYHYDGQVLCVNCYRNEARRGIDDVITKRSRLKIPKI